MYYKISMALRLLQLRMVNNGFYIYIQTDWLGPVRVRKPWRVSLTLPTPNTSNGGVRSHLKEHLRCPGVLTWVSWKKYVSLYNKKTSKMLLIYSIVWPERLYCVIKKKKNKNTQRGGVVTPQSSPVSCPDSDANLPTPWQRPTGALGWGLTADDPRIETPPPNLQRRWGLFLSLLKGGHEVTAVKGGENELIK